MLGVVANDHLLDGSIDSVISRSDGLVLLGFFIIFLYYTYIISQQSSNTEGEFVQTSPLWKSIGFTTIGLAGLLLGEDPG